jgi:hypothetical protein
LSATCWRLPLCYHYEDSRASKSGRAIFAETAGCGKGVHHSTDNGDSWTLADIGLTSTNVAPLAVNGSNDRVFAGARSIIEKDRFQSTDNEENKGFTPLEVKSVVLNAIFEARLARCSDQ